VKNLDSFKEIIIRLAHGARRHLTAARIFFHDLIWPNNVLKIEALPREWRDRDHRMFHAIFQLLVDFVELEQPFADYDRRRRGRYTDLAAMRAYVESNYNTDEGRAAFYGEWYSEEERRQADERTTNTYHTYTEILDCYEWYKTKKYELDAHALYDRTGQDLSFENGTIEHVDNGKPKELTWEQVFELEQEHEKLCDLMLTRVLRVRRYLWT